MIDSSISSLFLPYLKVPKDLVNASLVCKEWHAIIHSTDSQAHNEQSLFSKRIAFYQDGSLRFETMKLVASDTRALPEHAIILDRQPLPSVHVLFQAVDDSKQIFPVYKSLNTQITLLPRDREIIIKVTMLMKDRILRSDLYIAYDSTITINPKPNTFELSHNDFAEITFFPTLAGVYTLNVFASYPPSEAPLPVDQVALLFQAKVKIYVR